jgi:hypothetical protein
MVVKMVVRPIAKLSEYARCTNGQANRASSYDDGLPTILGSNKAPDAVPRARIQGASEARAAPGIAGQRLMLPLGNRLIRRITKVGALMTRGTDRSANEPRL